MEFTSEQIRSLKMHEWLLASNATMASERISMVWGEDTSTNLTSEHVFLRSLDDVIFERTRGGCRSCDHYAENSDHRLMLRFVDDTFDPEIAATIGVDFRVTTLNV
ncbi:hypothetical protein KIN20_011530 [Parelaphostrongylus tenuis]|uniref:Uncharacterized protein n=1 Tax=Parelaphostrongylus tenuis TaxID=148309 RepID=A0AAD5QM39_PARTN|nr:hypothetical protein KIN20_011530 [Parelaphostrongylus tenuis]